MKLTMTAFVTLDGVAQAPGGSREDRSGGFLHGGWFIPFVDEDFGRFIVEVFSRAGAFLLGRRTYEIFAGHWPKVTEPADPVASALNRLPKYVASRNLGQASWGPSTPVRDVAEEVARLKRAEGKELQVHGSAALAQTLLAHELIDEIHLVEAPILLGSGRRLFGNGVVPAAFERVATRTTSKGLLLSILRAAGRPAYAEAPAPT